MSYYRSLISQALQSIRSATGVSVVYTRPDVGWVKVTAVPGVSEFASTDMNHAAVGSQSRDYLISVADLRIADQAITPKRGDTITETVVTEDGSTEVTYMVNVPDQPKAQVYRYTDHGQTQFRIHTMRTGSVIL